MKSTAFTTFIYLAIIFLSACGGGGAIHPQDGEGTATLTWTKPTQNTDGSVLTDLTGFYIYYGTESDYLGNITGFRPYVDFVENSGSLTENNMACNDTGDKMECTITGLDNVANWYFAVTAVNSLSIESARSDIVCKAFSNTPCLL